MSLDLSHSWNYFDFKSLICTVIVTVVTSLFIYGLTVGKKKKDERHGIPPLAPGGMIAAWQAVSSETMPWYMLDMARSLKSNIFRLSLPIPGCPMVLVVGDVDTVRQVLSDPLSTKPRVIYSDFDHATAGHQTMFTSNGDLWYHRRKAIMPAFSSSHVKRMNRVALDKTDEWINNKLKPMMANNQSIDVAEEMVDITLSAICETAFEYSIGSDEKAMFLSELELALREFLFSTPWRTVLGFLLPQRRRAHSASKNCMALVQKMMHNYRHNLKNPTKDTIIDRIMQSNAYQNDDERAAELLTFLVAGHDTTGYSLAWILLELARNPKELQHLRASLLGLTENQWSQSDSLKRVIKEAMRLHPVAAGGSIRAIGKDMTVPGKDGKKDFILPKDAILFMPFMLLFRNHDTYPNADSFQPSRWENPTKEQLSTFLPFSLGKQNCVGQSLANSELFCIIARLASEYDFSVDQEPDVSYFLTLKPVGAKLFAHKAGSTKHSN